MPVRQVKLSRATSALHRNRTFGEVTVQDGPTLPQRIFHSVSAARAVELTHLSG